MWMLMVNEQLPFMPHIHPFIQWRLGAVRLCLHEIPAPLIYSARCRHHARWWKQCARRCYSTRCCSSHGGGNEDTVHVRVHVFFARLLLCPSTRVVKDTHMVTRPLITRRRPHSEWLSALTLEPLFFILVMWRQMNNKNINISIVILQDAGLQECV